MFVIVTVDEKSAAITAKGHSLLIRKFFLHSTSFTCRTEQVSGVHVAYLTLPSATHVPWRRLAHVIGSRPVLLSNRLKIPPHWGQLASSPCFDRQFSDLLTMRTAIQTLEQSPTAFPNLCLGILDPAAAYFRLAELALLHLPNIKIYTQNLPRGRVFATEMLHTYGAPVVITNQLESLWNCSLLVAFDEVLTEEIAKTLPPVLYSPSLPHSSDPRAICCPPPTVPKDLRPFLPDDIDPLSFLSALHDRTK